MKRLTSFVVGIVVPAFILAGGIASSAVAQEKAKAPAKAEITSKLLFENNKVKAVELRYPPGVVSPSALRPDRIVHTIKGGTIVRTYPDGKTQKIESKTGETRWLEAATYEFKNVGKSDYVLHVVFVK
jgi:hypothetical protein